MSDRRRDGDDGPLGDRAAQRANQRAQAFMRRRERQNLETLLGTPAFIEWLGSHVQPFLLGDMKTNNGGDLQHFMGERSLALRQLRDFAEVSPNFVERVLTARRVVVEEANNASRSGAQGDE